MLGKFFAQNLFFLHVFFFPFFFLQLFFQISFHTPKIMFYHFEELKVTLVVPKSRKNDSHVTNSFKIE